MFQMNLQLFGGRGGSGGVGGGGGTGELSDEEKKYMFQVFEVGKDYRRSYMQMMTDKEMTAYLKGKQDMNGFIPGIGGDRSYAINAWHVDELGNGYIDFEEMYRRRGYKF